MKRGNERAGLPAPNPAMLPVFEHKGKLVADSRNVAPFVEKDHAHLLRDIRRYVKAMERFNESNPDNEDECIMVHVKCSNAPKGQSIAYTIGDRGGVHWVGSSPMTVDDLAVIARRKERKEKGVPYENEPLVQVFNQLITDRPGGGFWSYADLKSEGAKILGFPPFYSTADLKQKLDSTFSREIRERDGLIITCGCKQKGVRGIRIEQYQHPQGYQTSIPEAGRGTPGPQEGNDTTPAPDAPTGAAEGGCARGWYLPPPA